MILMSRYKGQLLGGKRERGTIHYIALKAFTMTMGYGECFFSSNQIAGEKSSSITKSNIIEQGNY